MEVETIVTVGLGITMIVDTIGTDETVITAIITAIIGIMAGVMMNNMEKVGMTIGVITVVTMEMATVVVDMGDMTII